jgi:hypothetical protein
LRIVGHAYAGGALADEHRANAMRPAPQKAIIPRIERLAKDVMSASPKKV